MNNFFTENIDNSGAGACSYNETAININTGYGDGSSYDDTNFNNGKGRKTGQCNYKKNGAGNGMAKGCNSVSYHLKLRKINYNGRYR